MGQIWCKQCVRVKYAVHGYFSAWLVADCLVCSSCVGSRSSRSGSIHVWWSHGECAGTEAHPVHSQALRSLPGKDGGTEGKTKQRWGNDTREGKKYFCMCPLCILGRFSVEAESVFWLPPVLSSADPQQDWTPHRLEMCLWASTIATQQQLPLLKDVNVKGSSVVQNCSDTDQRPTKKLKTR